MAGWALCVNMGSVVHVGLTPMRLGFPRPDASGAAGRGGDSRSAAPSATLCVMSQSSSESSAGRSLGRTVVAALILIVAVWLLLGFVIHIVSFLFSIVVVVLLVFGIIWALRVLL